MSERKNKKKNAQRDDNNTLVCDRANRRDVRLGTIIGIVAILVTFCSVLFRYTKSVIAFWPESGYIYYILIWSILLIPLSATLIICVDIVFYVIADLNRYNLENEEYQKYDKESDIKYSLMINDFKIMLGVFCVWIIVIAIINAFYQRSVGSIIYGVLTTSILVLGGIFLIKKIACGEVKREKVWDVFKRLVVLIIMVCFVLLVVITLVTNNSAKADIIFDENGDIVIENAIDEDFGTVSLSVKDDGGHLIDRKDVLAEDVLQARESTGRRIKNNNGEEIGKALGIPGELLYWKYRYRTNELELSDGKYYVVIEIVQEKRTVKIINMFELRDSIYIFCKDAIHKEY